MKPILAVITVLLLAASHAECRIGETLDQLITRFGEGKKNSGKIRMAGHDQYYFEKDGLGIQCVISDGKCVMEVFHRIDFKITDRDIRDLLNTECEGHIWIRDEKTDLWMRSDKKLRAFRQSGHADMFFIEEVGINKEHENEIKGKPGF